jgi:hypothetical protein
VFLAHWQADLYKHPERPGDWYLLVCTTTGQIKQETIAPQREINAQWLRAQLQQLPEPWPDAIAVFRPQCLGLFEQATQELPLTIVPTRRTTALKLLLTQRWQAGAIAIESPPPQPLPEDLWGENWRIGAIAAQELDLWRERPIPLRDLPAELDPVRLGLASDQLIPGIVINGARRAMPLARWLATAQPYSVTYIPTEVGQSGGLVLASGLRDRWILATFEDAEMAMAAAQYQAQLEAAAGLHFLLVQPDDSGMTFTGLWLLRV